MDRRSAEPRAKSAAARSLELADRARLTMQRTGRSPSGAPLWTPDEMATLVRFAPDLDAATSALPRRSRGAVWQKAVRMDLPRPRRFLWSADEVWTLKGCYRVGAVDEIRRSLPRMGAQQIYAKAARHGLRRPRRPPKLIGISPLDAVRQRAFDMGLALIDLDTLAGTGRYFQRGRCLMLGHLLKGVEVLGGKVQIAWRGAAAE